MERNMEMKLEAKEMIFSLRDRKTPSCHASTLITLPGGGLMAAWFGGTREGAEDVEIWCARRGGNGWSEPKQLSNGGKEPCWNPVLYRAGEIVTLWYKQGTPIPDWRTMVTRSFDGGETWTHPREAVPGDHTGGRGPVKNKPLLLQNGWLLAGASHESREGKWLPFADISQDGGETWFRSAYLSSFPQANLIQPALWESESGAHMLLRSNAGSVYKADSRDQGRTWTAARPIDVPNNNSGLDCVRLPDGRVALVCNPIPDRKRRTPLSLLLSRDDGESFERVLDLETADAELSYPAVIWADGGLHITFTFRREQIMYCRVDIA